MFDRLAAIALLLLAACTGPASVALEDGIPADQAAWAEACTDWDEWDKPGPPFKVFGNTYYVGTCGITVLLINTPQGSIVIDGGPRGSGDLIASNIQTLGFELNRVTLHLISHEHHDHVGGLAQLQRRTGAVVMASDAAAKALAAGTAVAGDPQFDLHETFDPAVAKDTIIRPGYRTGNFRLGDLTLTPISTPGHTPGAMSYTWQSCDGENCRTIVYADSLTPVSADSYRFSDHPQYLAAFRSSIDAIAALDCDILLTPHPSASGLRDKLLADDLTGGPNCKDYATAQLKRLEERLAVEAQAK